MKNAKEATYILERKGNLFMTKEQKFYNTLQDVFIGADIEGTGGFVNLMKIKSNYYRKPIRNMSL